MGGTPITSNIDFNSIPSSAVTNPDFTTSPTISKTLNTNSGLTRDNMVVVKPIED